MKRTFIQTMCGAKALTLIFAALACVAFTSCGDDEDEGGVDDITSDELPASTAAELPIPASVVDGVRMASIGTDGGSAAASVTYNDDGSISKAEIGGNEYTFEYEDTRAVNITGAASTTGRKLKYVRLKITYNDGGNSYRSYEDIVYNFKFNSQGFIASCDEMEREYRNDNDGYSERETIKLSSEMAYNADGRLSKISISSKANYWDSENGSDPVLNSNADLNYSYTDNNLTSLSLKSSDDEGTVSITGVPSYTGAIENTYNIITIEMAEAMVPYSPILEIMAILGYLGNASATLPTKLVITDIETDEDGTARDVTTSNISYTFLDDNKINTVSVTGSNNYTYKYLWAK